MPEGVEKDGVAGQTGINCRGLTSLSLEEKSFFLPGAHFSGLPAASSQRGNLKTFVLSSNSGSQSAVSCTFQSVSCFMHFKITNFLLFDYYGHNIVLLIYEQIANRVYRYKNILNNIKHHSNLKHVAL